MYRDTDGFKASLLACSMIQGTELHRNAHGGLST